MAVPGLIAIAAVLGLAIFVLTYARVGALRGATFRVYLPVEEVRNVMPGTEVWLAGKRVGAVRRIEFRPITTDTTQRLLLELTILRSSQPLIRLDSEGVVRSGGTLLGAQVVNLTVGTTATRAVVPGDTLRPAQVREAPDFASTLAALGAEFTTIAENVRTLREATDGLTDRVGTIDRDRQRVMSLLRGPIGRPARQAGSLQLLMEDDELGARLQRISAGIDSVRVALDAPRGTLGRLRHEQLLQDRLASLSTELGEINRLLEGGYGTAGRLTHDRALAEGLEALRLEIDLLTEDARRWPERYIRF